MFKDCYEIVGFIIIIISILLLVYLSYIIMSFVYTGYSQSVSKF